LSATIPNETAPSAATAAHNNFVCSVSELLLVGFIDSSRTAKTNHFQAGDTSIKVKHFQAIRHLSVDVAHGLALLFELGTQALPSWDSKMRWNNLLGDLAVDVTAGSSGHTNSPHPSSREGHHSTVGVRLAANLDAHAVDRDANRGELRSARNTNPAGIRPAGSCCGSDARLDL
jgi:hypothetical protein